MPLLSEVDYGTPKIVAAQLVSLEIDGQPVTVPAGTSVMRAAAEAGIGIPKLCATDSMKAFGSCRLCLVEIEGKRGTPASCTLTVEPGTGQRMSARELPRRDHHDERLLGQYGLRPRTHRVHDRTDALLVHY